MNFPTKHQNLYRYTVWFFIINAAFFCLLGFSYLHSILSSASLFDNSIVDYSHSFSGKVIIVGFAIIYYFSYMIFLGFLPAVLVLLLVLVLPYPRLIWCISILLVAISLLFLVVDTRVFSMFKFHLNGTILSLIFSRHWVEIFDFSNYELTIFALIISTVLFMECFLARVVWKKIVLGHRYKWGKIFFIFWVGGALWSYLTLMLSIAQHNNLFSQQTPNLPIFNNLFAYIIPDKNARDILLRYSEHHYSQPNYSNDPFNYPLHPMVCSKPQKSYNLIFIMVDSLRFTSLQPQIMPNVWQFSAKSWNFLNYLSGGNSTQPGLFTMFYSIPATYWTATLDQKKAPVLMDLLAKAHYAMKVMWSMPIQNPPFDKTIFMNIPTEDLIEPEGYDLGEIDEKTTSRAIEFLNEKKTNPFFLHIFYEAAHGYCRNQSFTQVFQPAQGPCNRIGRTNETDPTPYYNRYLNAVYFLDNEIGKILHTIEQKGYLENSIVIVTSDHGQEFNDNHQNYWEHAGNFTRSQVQVPLLIHWPGESGGRVEYLTSSYDIVPTLLQRLFSCTNPVEDYSIGQNLFSPNGRSPFLLMGSYVNTGIFEPERITTLEASGRIIITDKHAAPISDTKGVNENIDAAMGLMRKYFVHTKH